MISPVQILCLPLHDGFNLSTVRPSKFILPVVSLRYLVTEVMRKGNSTTNASPQHLSAHISGAKLSHIGKPKVSMGERYIMSPSERKET